MTLETYKNRLIGVLNSLGMKLCVLSFLLGACGSDPTKVDFTEKLVISMNSVFEEPAGVTGNNEPKNMTFTMTGLSVTDNEGTATDLFDDADPVVAKIISRSQIIFEGEIADLEGSTISSITVTLAAAGVATSPGDEELAFTLAVPTVVHNEEWAVGVSKSFRLKLLVQWKNIVTVDEDSGAESIQAPTITTDFVDE